MSPTMTMLPIVTRTMARMLTDSGQTVKKNPHKKHNMKTNPDIAAKQLSTGSSLGLACDRFI